MRVCLNYFRKKRLFKRCLSPYSIAENKEKAWKHFPNTRVKQQAANNCHFRSKCGGKSITLKTIGLLQVMLQSGLLIPVHFRSETCFLKIYWLILATTNPLKSVKHLQLPIKNMRDFLRKCNDRTLFLIDEFGTGSDPELGGALAEIFWRNFTKKKLRNHYNTLRQFKSFGQWIGKCVNANMQFDEKTLRPLFKLFIGQAGILLLLKSPKKTAFRLA